MYTEANLAKREMIRDHPDVLEWLDKWWIAAQEFDDKDKDGGLDFDEYTFFHGRLKKWIHTWAALRGVTLPKASRAEAREQLEEDFAADSGEGQLVLHVDFVNSIFELADMWTESVNRHEYVDFLARGYEDVFKQHLDQDAINFPGSWRRYLDEDSSDEDSDASDESLIDMPEAAVMEYIVDVRVGRGGVTATSHLGSRSSQITARVGRATPRRVQSVARSLKRRGEMTSRKLPPPDDQGAAPEDVELRE